MKVKKQAIKKSPYRLDGAKQKPRKTNCIRRPYEGNKVSASQQAKEQTVQMVI